MVPPTASRPAAARAAWLARVHRPRLVTAARRVGTSAHAEDAVQDVLAALAASTRPLPAGDDELLRYAIVSVRRRARRLAGRSAATAADALDPELVPAHGADVPDRVEARRLWQSYLAALRHVPAPAREVLMLSALETPQEEIAAATGSSVRRVRRAIERHREPVRRLALGLDPRGGRPALAAFLARLSELLAGGAATPVARTAAAGAAIVLASAAVVAGPAPEPRQPVRTPPPPAAPPATVAARPAAAAPVATPVPAPARLVPAAPRRAATGHARRTSRPGAVLARRPVESALAPTPAVAPPAPASGASARGSATPASLCGAQGLCAP